MTAAAYTSPRTAPLPMLHRFFMVGAVSHMGYERPCLRQDCRGTPTMSPGSCSQFGRTEGKAAHRQYFCCWTQHQGAHCGQLCMCSSDTPGSSRTRGSCTGISHISDRVIPAKFMKYMPPTACSICRSPWFAWALVVGSIGNLGATPCWVCSFLQRSASGELI